MKSEAKNKKRFNDSETVFSLFFFFYLFLYLTSRSATFAAVKAGALTLLCFFFLRSLA